MKMRSLQPGNAKNVLKTAKKITKKEPLPAKQGEVLLVQIILRILRETNFA